MPSLKIFIVDDEYLIRNLIKMRIKWEELDMEIVGESPDARQALEMIDALVPDIIFTDICMPFMDGIEFSKNVIEKYPHVKIVVITGHDEFDYAKRSIKLGISDFLLKPINAEEIKRVALELKRKIEAERTQIKAYEKLKQHLEQNLPYIKEKFMIQLLQGELSASEIADKLVYFRLDVNPCSDYFQTAVVEVSSSIKVKDAGEENSILLDIQCAERIRQITREDDYTWTFFDNSRKIVLMSNNEALDLTECCEAIKTMIINSCNCFVCIGIGSRVHGIENIKISYREACDALNYKVVIGKNQVINYSDITYSNEVSRRSIPNKAEKIDFYIKAGMKEKMYELIEELFAEDCYCSAVTVENLRLEAFDVLSACMHVLLELKIDGSSLWEYPTQAYEQVSRIDNLVELKSYIKSLITRVINKVHSINEKKANSLIMQICDYIQCNMSNSELSLSAVAKEFFISPSHLCRLFKQGTNQTFVEYLTKVRMERAVKILMESNLKVYEIGEKIGINDSHYFSIIFKKYTGCSINEFRKNSKA